MEYINIKFDIESPFYVFFKSHFCPDCETKMSPEINSYICSRGEPGAEAFDFSSAMRGQMIGRTKFLWVILKCKKCGRRLSVKQMKSIEGADR